MPWWPWFFARGDFESNCHVSFANAANVLAPRNDFYLFTDVDGMSVVNASGIDYVSGILLADEGDGNLDQNLRVSTAVTTAASVT